MSRRQFYTMRFARIVPCLLGLLAILTVADRLGVPRFTINTQHTSLWRALLAALTFHINWLEASTGYLPAAWDVLWSLSVEELFYVFFPLLCKWTRKEAVLIALLGAFVVAGRFARVLTQNALWSEYGYLQSMDGIAAGCLAAIIAGKIRLGDKRKLVLRTLKLTGTALCLLITVFRGTVERLGFYKTGLDVTVLGIGAALLIIALGLQQQFESKTAPGLWEVLSSRSTAFLRWFGRNSYELYLTHMLVVWSMGWAFFYVDHPLNSAPF